MSRRVFLITNLKLKVFEWHGHHLAYAFEFKNDEQGLEEFKDYISSVKRKAVNILFDLLEEDFQREKVPHAHGSDKQLLIDRLKKRHYRNNIYIHAHQLSREKGGRKDDEILLSSLSNMEPISGWLDLLLELEIPVAGMWSVSLLSEKLICHLQEKKQNILLISRQMKSSMRESFIKKGKLIISRQVRIEKQFLGEDSVESYITQSVSQIHRFLSNSRIIGFNDTLHVKCIIPEKLINEAQSNFKDTENIKYIFLTVEDLFKRIGIKSHLENKQADVIFSYLCSKQKPGSDHYARKVDKKDFHKLLIEKGISNFTYAASILLFLISAALVSGSISLNAEKELVDANFRHLSQKYQQEYSPYEKEIGFASPIEQNVHFAELLKHESDYSPEKIFLPLSDVFSRPQNARVNLTSFKWKKYHGEPLRQLVIDMNKMATKRVGDFESFGFEEEVTVKEGRTPLVELSGLVDRNEIAYRDTVAIMNRFVTDLRELSIVQYTWVKQIPVDTRVYSRFSDQSGVDESRRVFDENADKFIIFILLNPTHQPSLDENLSIDHRLQGQNRG